MYPDAVRPIYFLSDREDSQAYHLKWRKHRLMHLCRSVDVSRLLSEYVVSWQNKLLLIGGSSVSLKLLDYFTRELLLDYLSSKVAIYFNVNY